MGFLGVLFEVEGGGVKLVRIMQETSNLAVSTHPYVVSENIPFST